MKREQKGITLVALIVTIIILLILAGISIATLTGSGLFENARLAEQKSKNAQEKEESILGDYENKIGEYIDNSRDTVNIAKEEYEQLKNANKYSTDEVKVGTWVNGKPIYRKVFTGLSVSTGTTKDWVSIVEIDNIEALINTTLLFNNNREEYIPLEFYYSGSDVRILTTTLIGVSRTIETCIIEYTKTTE